jgi:hypothetical protein
MLNTSKQKSQSSYGGKTTDYERVRSLMQKKQPNTDAKDLLSLLFTETK